MLQIPRNNSGLHPFNISSHFGIPNIRKVRHERDLLPALPDPAAMLHRQQLLYNNRSGGTYSLNEIRRKMVEATRGLKEIDRNSTTTATINNTTALNPTTTAVSPPGIRPVAETTSTTSIYSVDDIVLSDGTTSYSLGKNVDIRISDGELIINNTDHYRFDESSTLRISQLMTPDANGIQQQNDLLTISRGVATVNHAANFDVYEDGVTSNQAGAYLQLQIVNGSLPGQSSVPNSLFFGNGTNSVPIGTLKAQGADYMVTSNDQTQMVFSLQDERGEYFIWQVEGDPTKISAAFDDIHSRVHNETLSYAQLQDIANSHGL